MLIMGGLFALALVALVLAIFMAREEQPQTATASAQASASTSEVVKTEASVEEKEIGRKLVEEETVEQVEAVEAVEPVAVPVAQVEAVKTLEQKVEQSGQQATDVVQPTLNEIVSPMNDGYNNTGSLHHTQGQIQELIAIMRQLQGQMQTLEHRVNYISAQVNRRAQDDEPNTGATFVDIPAISRNRHP